MKRSTYFIYHYRIYDGFPIVSYCFCPHRQERFQPLYDRL